MYRFLVVGALMLTSSHCGMRSETADFYISSAFSIANDEVAFDKTLIKNMRAPSHISSKEELVEWSFNRAIALDASGSDAYFNQAFYFMTIGVDCEQATASLRAQLDISPDWKDLPTLIAIVESEGCVAGLYFMRDYMDYFQFTDDFEYLAPATTTIPTE